MLALFALILRSFSHNYGTHIEQYIVSKNIKSISDVEYWSREYERKNKANYF
jgi:hypothetical protein